MQQFASDLLESARALLGTVDFPAIFRATLIVGIGFAVAGWLYRRLPVQKLHPQHQMVVRTGVKYVTVALSIATGLRVLGVSLDVVLGTAGLLTVTLGFAAQTSASNLISGIFLMAERPFVIGDAIRVGETFGTVVSIDLVSVRLRSFDNLLVRITNETMLKSNVTNLSHNPIRRVDMPMRIAFDSDIARVREILLGVAERSPIALEEPKPRMMLLGYGDSWINVQFSVWTVRENFLDLRDEMYENCLKELRAAGISMPYPRHVIYRAADGSGALVDGPSTEGEKDSEPSA